MWDAFLISFKLKNTYRANSIIHSFQGIPIINKILPDSLYRNKGLKVLADVISILWEIVSTFLGKFLYVLFMLFFMTMAYGAKNSVDIFLHLFVFLTIAGGILNTYMFNPTKDKYYALILMNMNAGGYAVSNYLYMMLKVLVGFLPFTIIFGLMQGVPLWICIIMPVFVAMVKMTMIFYDIHRYKTKGIVTNENLPEKVRWISVALLLALAYGLPMVKVTINQTLFIILFLVSLVSGICSLVNIVRFKDYKKLYKALLTKDNVYMAKNMSSTETIRKNVAKSIEYDSDFTSTKEGFAYFHELFVKRHGKLLTKSAKKQTFYVVLIMAFIIGVSCFVPFASGFKEAMNGIPLNFLPYFVFVMYMLNRGTVITQAMFMNCDHSMLTYRVYRTPKVILGLFKQRLKTLILINLMPSAAISIGLALILYVTGGTANPFNYVAILVSINAMSIFFSVHYLVMYYLLQPYTVSTELKNGTYKIVQAITYFVCWIMLQVKLPTLQFGIATTIFCIAYILISLRLAYKYAPKTFKIRL